MIMITYRRKIMINIIEKRQDQNPAFIIEVSKKKHKIRWKLIAKDYLARAALT